MTGGWSLRNGVFNGHCFVAIVEYIDRGIHPGTHKLQWFSMMLRTLSDSCIILNILYDMFGYAWLTALLITSHTDCMGCWDPALTNMGPRMVVICNLWLIATQVCIQLSLFCCYCWLHWQRYVSWSMYIVSRSRAGTVNNTQMLIINQQCST